MRFGTTEAKIDNSDWDSSIAESLKSQDKGDFVNATIYLIKALRSKRKAHIRGLSKRWQELLGKLQTKDYEGIIRELFPNNLEYLKLFSSQTNDVYQLIIAYLLGGTEGLIQFANEPTPSIKQALSKFMEIFPKNFWQQQGDEDRIKKHAEAVSDVLQALQGEAILPNGKIGYTIEAASAALPMIISAMQKSPNNQAAADLCYKLIYQHLKDNNLDHLFRQAFPNHPFLEEALKLIPNIARSHSYLLLVFLLTRGAQGLQDAIARISLTLYAQSQQQGINEMQHLLQFAARLQQLLHSEPFKHLHQQFFQDISQKEQNADLADLAHDLNGQAGDQLHINKILLLAAFDLIRIDAQDDLGYRNTLLHLLIANEIPIINGPYTQSLIEALVTTRLLQPPGVDLPDTYGQTLAILATRIPNPQTPFILEQLRKAGADFLKVDNDGNTALHYCALLGSQESFKAILRDQSLQQRKQLLNIRNKQGKTPLEIIDDNAQLLESNSTQLKENITKLLRQLKVNEQRSINAYGNFFRINKFDVVFVNKCYAKEQQDIDDLDECCRSTALDHPLILHPSVQTKKLFEDFQRQQDQKKETTNPILVDKRGTPLDKESFTNLKSRLETLDSQTLLECCISGVSALKKIADMICSKPSLAGLVSNRSQSIINPGKAKITTVTPEAVVVHFSEIKHKK